MNSADNRIIHSSGIARDLNDKRISFELKIIENVHTAAELSN